MTARDLFEPITTVAGESAGASAQGMECDHVPPAGTVEAARLTANPRPDLEGSAVGPVGGAVPDYTPRGLNRDTAGPADRGGITLDRAQSASCAPLALDRSGTSTGGSHSRAGNADHEPPEALAVDPRRAPISAQRVVESTVDVVAPETSATAAAVPPTVAHDRIEPRARARICAEGGEGTCGTCAVWEGREIGFGACGYGAKSALLSRLAWCQFTPSKWVAIAQAGIDQAVAAADRAVEGWSERALEFIRLWALDNIGKRFIGTDIVQASIAAGITQPPNAKAWGGPIQRAARARFIRKVGTAPDPNRHGNPVPLWEAA